MRAIAIAAVLFLLAVSAGCGSSGDAVEVSGPGTFRSGGNIFVNSISCAAPGDCPAGGYYRRGFGEYQAFVVDETNGTWGNAIEVPHAATPLGDSFPAPGVNSISCAAAGDCAAGGSYYDRRGDKQAFVVNETDGRWGNAIKVHGTALHTDRWVELNSLSCAAAGECAAGGVYADGDGYRAFVVSETNGRWGNAIEVPGMATLNTGGDAEVDSISCAAAGECAAGGFYDHGHSVDGSFQAFVVSETNGSWGNAVKVPGTATLNTGRNAEVDSISCAAAGECAAGGVYNAVGDTGQAFVVSETNGTWGNAIEVPGSAKTLHDNFSGSWISISCAAAGECAAGGSYDHGLSSDYSEANQAFVAGETNGSWGKAINVPGTATLNAGGHAGVLAVSCGAAGECAAGGYYTDSSGDDEAFVVSETNGSWGNAIEVPGTATRRWPFTEVTSISCAAPGDCTAGGHLSTGYSRGRAFVVNETNGSWGNAILLPPAACVFPNVNVASGRSRRCRSGAS